MLTLKPEGLYCPQGDFYIDPWRRVPRAVITHAHADHARTGMEHYLAQEQNESILRLRLGKNIQFQGLPFGEKIHVNGVQISFHPAGHIPASAQVRLEYQGEVWVVTGDYKLQNDGLSAPFETVKCHTIITESTFGIPAYRWTDSESIFEEIKRWWAANIRDGKSSQLTAYSLGKAQRLIMGLQNGPGPLFVHPTIAQNNQALIRDGFKIPDVPAIHASVDPETRKQALVIVPPSGEDNAILKKWGEREEGVCSGWMAVRGQRRRNNVTRGFVLSDHADWNGLLEAIDQSGAERVLVTHGYSDILSRFLRESRGLNAEVLRTEFGGDES